ncbi:hypothetical protein RJ55_04242 [Drechmeria coniospora]|nr:hypothetical protein RJ55_04242 [Drechmeria coniospora]
MLPSGLVHPKCINLIGSVVFAVSRLFTELKELKAKKLELTKRIFASGRCEVNFEGAQSQEARIEQANFCFWSLRGQL